VKAYSIDEAAKMSGVCRTRFYQILNDGLVPAKKCGKRTLILEEDLQKFLQELPAYKPQKDGDQA
jgi:excisionase family DNA binding protein